jgi:hypothetical protein
MISALSLPAPRALPALPAPRAPKAVDVSSTAIEACR